MIKTVILILAQVIAQVIVQVHKVNLDLSQEIEKKDNDFI